MVNLINDLQRAIKADGRTCYALAKASRLNYAIVRRFATNERPDVGLRTASKLCEALGLRLTHDKPKGKDR